MKKKKKVTREEALALCKALQVNDDRYMYIRRGWCSELQMPIVDMISINGIERAIKRLKEKENE